MFGGYDEKFAYPNRNITWNKLVNLDYWTVNLSQVFFGEFVLESDSRTAIIDSGTSYVVMPYKDFGLLLLFLEEYDLKFKEAIASQIMYATCSKKTYDDLPNLNIFIDNNHYVLPKESYIHREFGFCYLLVIAKDFRPGGMFGRNMWILGNNFLSNYYSIYDLENQRIGLV